MLFGAHELLGSIKHEECFEQQMTTNFSKKRLHDTLCMKTDAV